MLFPLAQRGPVAAGEITVAFRRWRRPTVRAGGTLQHARWGCWRSTPSTASIPARSTTRTPGGPATPTPRRCARRCAATGETYRIAFHLAGPDPRIALRADAALDDAGRAAIAARLARYDAASRHGPWTAATLQAIAAAPATRAADLAERLGRPELQPFKTDVRKLKALGLTESLEVGYRLSPRGRAFLDG